MGEDAPQLWASFKCMLKVGEGKGQKVCRSPHCWREMCGSRWWGWSLSLAVRRSALKFPRDWGFLSTLLRSCVFYQCEGSLSLLSLRLPGGWVALSFPHSFILLSLLFLDQLVLSLQGPTLCRGKRIISFVSNWCCDLIQQLRIGMLTLLFNKLLHSPC